MFLANRFSISVDQKSGSKIAIFCDDLMTNDFHDLNQSRQESADQKIQGSIQSARSTIPVWLVFRREKLTSASPILVRGPLVMSDHEITKFCWF